MVETLAREEKALIEEVTAQLRQLFPNEILAVYVIGSLAHGGYSRICSDIDVLLIFEDPLPHACKETLEQFKKTNVENKLALFEKLSLFYGSVQSINSGDKAIRLPAYDRQDLLEYGVLFYGKDIKSMIASPSMNEILLEGAKTYADIFELSEVKADCSDLSQIASKKDHRKLSKLILMPVRFLHTLYESTLASCENAVESFVSRESNPEAITLVEFALELRGKPEAMEKFSTLHDPSKILTQIYYEFFSHYENKLIELGESELVQFYTQAKKFFHPG